MDHLAEFLPLASGAEALNNSRCRVSDWRRHPRANIVDRGLAIDSERCRGDYDHNRNGRSSWCDCRVDISLGMCEVLV